MNICGRAFQAEEKAHAKALWWACTWHVQEKTPQPTGTCHICVCAKHNRLSINVIYIYIYFGCAVQHVGS